MFTESAPEAGGVDSCLQEILVVNSRYIFFSPKARAFRKSERLKKQAYCMSVSPTSAPPLIESLKKGIAEAFRKILVVRWKICYHQR